MIKKQTQRETKCVSVCGWDQFSPEWVGKFNGDAEIAVRLVDTVHANPQLSSVASTCCECKDRKKLQTAS